MLGSKGDGKGGPNATGLVSSMLAFDFEYPNCRTARTKKFCYSSLSDFLL